MVPLPPIEIKLETLEEKADRIAIAHGVSTTTLRNLVWSESRWNPNARGDEGNSYGLVQIHLPDNPGITEAEATDPEFALTFAAEKLAAGEEWRWTVCSCVKSVRAVLPQLPKGDAKDFIPNSPPTVGGIVIYKYPNGKYHVAALRSFAKDGSGYYESGSNLEPCLSYERFVAWDNPYLVGFATYPVSSR